MFRPFLFAALLLPSAVFAATASATLEVSLTIKESCRVDRGEREPPRVNCRFDAPYRVQADDGKRAPPARLMLEPARWEVMF